MRLADLPAGAAAQRLAGPGLKIRTGPFVYRICSPIPLVAEGLYHLYGNFPVVPDEDFADFTVTIAPGSGVRRWMRRQARFLYDGQGVFEPLPDTQAYLLLEWAMNWCISSQAHQYLIIHAAVVERGDCAVVLPAPPGSGKSTLCAGMIQSGWRLLSDELALISLKDGMLWPLCRPVSLKNASIDVIRTFASQAVFNRITRDTAKGSVTHMRVPPEHLAQMRVPARPRWVIFPRYEPGAVTAMTVRSRSSSMVDLARNSFNFGVLGDVGFQLLCEVIEASDCLDFRYGELSEAVAAFDALAAAG